MTKTYRPTRTERLGWITFRTTEPILRRDYCHGCGLPVAYVTETSAINPDGTKHRGRCAHTYANRRASISGWSRGVRI